MMYYKLLLCMALITCFVAQVQALPPMLVDSNDLDWVGESAGDPLDPGFVGETMSMPLDPELIQKARDAGIIKDANADPQYGSASGSGVTHLGTPFASMEPDGTGMGEASAQAGQNVNVTGPWSLDLIALDQILRHMDLVLVQNKDVVMGYGAV